MVNSGMPKWMAYRFQMEEWSPWCRSCSEAPSTTWIHAGLHVLCIHPVDKVSNKKECGSMVTNLLKFALAGALSYSAFKRAILQKIALGRPLTTFLISKLNSWNARGGRMRRATMAREKVCQYYSNYNHCYLLTGVHGYWCSSLSIRHL